MYTKGIFLKLSSLILFLLFEKTEALLDIFYPSMLQFKKKYINYKDID